MPSFFARLYIYVTYFIKKNLIIQEVFQKNIPRAHFFSKRKEKIAGGRQAFSFPPTERAAYLPLAISLTISPAMISPITAGTNDTLPGVARRA